MRGVGGMDGLVDGLSFCFAGGGEGCWWWVRASLATTCVRGGVLDGARGFLVGFGFGFGLGWGGGFICIYRRRRRRRRRQQEDLTVCCFSVWVPGGGDGARGRQ